MKRLFLSLICCVVLCGCAYGTEKVRTVMDEPMKLLEDPLTMKYKEDLAQLEKSYLSDKITYAEYLQQKKTLEEDYARAVQKRETMIEP